MERHPALVACQDDRVIGFVSFGSCRDEGASPSQGEIWALYADPDVWGQGFGRSLLDHAIRDLRTFGRTEISLWVLRQNLRGIKFYQKFGFEPVSGSEKLSDLGDRKVEEICLRLQQDGNRVPSMEAAP